MACQQTTIAGFESVASCSMCQDAAGCGADSSKAGLASTIAAFWMTFVKRHPLVFTTWIACLLAAGFVLGAYEVLAVNVAQEAFIDGEQVSNNVAFAAEASRYERFSDREGFASLDAHSQAAYAALYKAAFLGRDTVRLSGFDGEELSGIMYAVWYDSPELFFVDPAVSIRTVTTHTLSDHAVATVSFDYLYDVSEIDEVRAEYEVGLANANEILAGCETDADKVRAIQAWVMSNVSYDDEAAAIGTAADADAVTAESDDPVGEFDPLPESATAYGALANGEALCGGYSQLFCALCRDAGVECKTVIGSVDGYGAAHAWNAVRLEGEWRCVDVTWNDAKGNPNAYYLESEEEFLADGHRPFENNIPPSDWDTKPDVGGLYSVSAFAQGVGQSDAILSLKGWQGTSNRAKQERECAERSRTFAEKRKRAEGKAAGERLPEAPVDNPRTTPFTYLLS